MPTHHETAVLAASVGWVRPTFATLSPDAGRTWVSPTLRTLGAKSFLTRRQSVEWGHPHHQRLPPRKPPPKNSTALNPILTFPCHPAPTEIRSRTSARPRRTADHPHGCRPSEASGGPRTPLPSAPGRWTAGRPRQAQGRMIHPGPGLPSGEKGSTGDSFLKGRREPPSPWEVQPIAGQGRKDPAAPRRARASPSMTRPGHAPRQNPSSRSPAGTHSPAQASFPGTPKEGPP
jgi:hypothetical protein